jgi:ribosomal protein S18 acetylase RimI-like enzyme
MYLAWIQRLLDSTYVAATGASVTAYVSCAEENGQARICLFAVAEPFRGRGIGRQLVDQTMWWAAERGLQQLTVVTQGSNEAALRLYQRNGFHIVRREVWFHWWRP